MSNFSDPKAFEDSEDSAIVAEAKTQLYDPVDYTYGEVNPLERYIPAISEVVSSARRYFV